MSAVPGRSTALHRPRVVIVAAAGLVAAMLLQTAILPAVGVAATAPVVYTLIAVMGLAWGQRAGTVAGFAGGLLLDLTGSGVLGVQALVGCLLGLAAGRIPVDRWRWSGFGWVVLAVLGAQAVTVGLDMVLAGRGAGLAAAAVLWSVGGAVVCAAVVLPARDFLRSVVR
jgi:rod shape-determining protein MreD